MSFRPPASLLSSSLGDSVTPLDLELAGEKADALGRAGRKAEEALQKLAGARGVDNAPIDALLHAAADAVFGLMVQRELCGLRNQGDMIRRYAIPADVMSRVGIFRCD
uniref:Uncharacterized protein n=1 Tax=Agrobacterium albertimagni TaxID=147266 RepID=A0A7C1SX67_9HYPH